MRDEVHLISGIMAAAAAAASCTKFREQSGWPACLRPFDLTAVRVELELLPPARTPRPVRLVHFAQWTGQSALTVTVSLHK